MHVRIGALVFTALVGAVALTGCDDREMRVTAPRQVGGSEEPAVQSRLAMGNGIAGCEGLDLASELPTDALVGSWRYLNSVWFYEGDNAYAYTTGDLVITADGRWDGARKASESSGVATGPGEWHFDGRSLTLSYDDESDSETYDAVLLSDQTDAEGTPFQALSLIIDYGFDGCLVHLLAAS